MSNWQNFLRSLREKALERLGLHARLEVARRAGEQEGTKRALVQSVKSQVQLLATTNDLMSELAKERALRQKAEAAASREKTKREDLESGIRTKRKVKVGWTILKNVVPGLGLADIAIQAADHVPFLHDHLPLPHDLFAALGWDHVTDAASAVAEHASELGLEDALPEMQEATELHQIVNAETGEHLRMKSLDELEALRARVERASEHMKHFREHFHLRPRV